MRVMLVAMMMCAATAVARGEEIAVVGAGSKSCASFAELYKKDPQFAELAFGAWAQGFLSGMNLRGGIETKPLRNLERTISELDHHIRHECDLHPLKDVLDVVWDYYNGLPFSPPP
jgi:hypothetical protein